MSVSKPGILSIHICSAGHVHIELTESDGRTIGAALEFDDWLDAVEALDADIKMFIARKLETPAPGSVLQ